MQVFFARSAHGALDFCGHSLRLDCIDFDNDFVVDDVHDAARRVAQVVVLES
jgi:hypothetical protein